MAAYIFNRPKDIAYYTVYCKATTAKMYTASITKKSAYRHVWKECAHGFAY